MDKMEVNELLDYYGGLLTQKQQEICRYYYRDDLSYQEISENCDISRAAVYDMIKRCREELARYEEILKMKQNSQKRRKWYSEITERCQDPYVLDRIMLCDESENEGGNYE